jgi:hypothetical protein
LQVQKRPRNLVVLRDKGEAKLFGVHPLVDRFNGKHGINLKVVSYNVADAAHNGSEIWGRLPICAVDASIAYEGPGKRLGREIVFAAENEPRVVLETGRYQGASDIALIAFGLTSDDFKKDGTAVQLDISDDRLIAVPDFPAASGWYKPHGKTGIPCGNEVGAGPEARWLDRMDTSYVGIVVRTDLFTHNVNATVKPSEKKLGVVAEVPENEAWRIEELIEGKESPEPPNQVTIRVPDISRARLRMLLQSATRSADAMASLLKDDVTAPIREFLDIIRKADI